MFTQETDVFPNGVCIFLKKSIKQLNSENKDTSTIKKKLEIISKLVESAQYISENDYPDYKNGQPYLCQYADVDFGSSACRTNIYAKFSDENNKWTVDYYKPTQYPIGYLAIKKTDNYTMVYKMNDIQMFKVSVYYYLDSGWSYIKFNFSLD